ncbi:hypothetical protein QUB33_24445 [Microcoleus sp. B3-A4]|uniref:hypothetical protein n=1 Tax=Microcoleus sp. B3-A4 TaxID=2818653 RepID=UPI002FD362E2
MNLENQTVIDVEVTEIDTPEPESIAIKRWYSAAQIQSILDLNKSGLQKAIAKLQDIYGIELKALRRGEARATQYSEFALKACQLLNAGKLSELRKLVETAPIAPTAGALTIAEYTPALDRRITQLNQNANSASASLNQNVQQLLAQIASENEAAQQRDSDLKQARINAAQNRGAAQALEIYQAEQKALNEVLAQLRARQLGGAE